MAYNIRSPVFQQAIPVKLVKLFDGIDNYQIGFLIPVIV